MGEGIIRFLTTNELSLSFLASNDHANFHQILFEIASTGAMTDTEMPAIYNLSHAVL